MPKYAHLCRNMFRFCSLLLLDSGAGICFPFDLRGLGKIYMRNFTEKMVSRTCPKVISSKLNLIVEDQTI